MVCCCLCGRPLAGHPTAPPFSSPALCLPLHSLLLPSCTPSNTHSPSSITSAQPGHLLPGLQQLAQHTHKCTQTQNEISYGIWDIQGGHTYGTITCTDSPLYSCHAPTNIRMTRNFIDIHTYTLYLAHTLFLSLLETVWLIKCTVSSLASKSV